MGPNIAENLRRFRKAKGLTQIQLMEKSGFKSIKRIEAGNITSPRFVGLQKICKLLGVTVSDLYAEPKKSRKRAT